MSPNALRTFIWFISLVHCSISWHDKFWTFLGVEGTQLHVMSSWLLSNCLRIWFRNVSHREQVNLSTWLMHQTVKAAGLCQHKVHCQCANHFPYTMPSLQTGHQHNLLQRHGFNLRCVKKTNWWNLAAQRQGWWEATSELWKALVEAPLIRVVAAMFPKKTLHSKLAKNPRENLKNIPSVEKKNACQKRPFKHLATSFLPTRHLVTKILRSSPRPPI